MALSLTLSHTQNTSSLLSARPRTLALHLHLELAPPSSSSSSFAAAHAAAAAAAPPGALCAPERRRRWALALAAATVAAASAPSRARRSSSSSTHPSSPGEGRPKTPFVRGAAIRRSKRRRATKPTRPQKELYTSCPDRTRRSRTGPSKAEEGERLASSKGPICAAARHQAPWRKQGETAAVMRRARWRQRVTPSRAPLAV